MLVKRFHWDSVEYAEAFATLVRSAGERVYERQILREIFSAYPAESHVVDWGGGIAFLDITISTGVSDGV